MHMERLMQQQSTFEYLESQLKKRALSATSGNAVGINRGVQSLQLIVKFKDFNLLRITKQSLNQQHLMTSEISFFVHGEQSQRNRNIKQCFPSIHKHKAKFP